MDHPLLGPYVMKFNGLDQDKWTSPRFHGLSQILSHISNGQYRDVRRPAVLPSPASCFSQAEITFEFFTSPLPRLRAASINFSRILSANAAAFNRPECSDIAFSFPVRGRPGQCRFVYARERFLRHFQSPYFADSELRPIPYFLLNR
jgi:hypothetical protein